MPNIHAINAQGTEYGIEAENGITQAQAAAIATIGDASELSTDAKTTLVAAINEVYEKVVEGAVVYENLTPTENQNALTVNVSGLTNAKALKITYGQRTPSSAGFKEEVFPLTTGAINDCNLALVVYDASEFTQYIYARRVSLNAARTVLDISAGTVYYFDTEASAQGVFSSAASAKVLKVVALF